MKNRRKGFTVVELLIILCVIAILAAVLIPYFSDLIGRAEDAAASYNAHAERYEQFLTEPIATTLASEPEPTIIETAAPETAPAPTEPPLPEPYEQVKRWNAILSASERTHPTMHDALTEVADGEENIPDIVNALFAAEAAAAQTAETPIIVWDQENDRFTVVTEKTSETVRFHSAPDEPLTELTTTFAYRLWRVYNEDTESPFDNSQRYNPYTVDVYSIYWAASAAPESLVNATKFYVGFDMGLWIPTMQIKICMKANHTQIDCADIPTIIFRTNGETCCCYHGVSTVAHFGEATTLNLANDMTGKNSFKYHESGTFTSLSWDDIGTLKHFTIVLDEGCELIDDQIKCLKDMGSKKNRLNIEDNRNGETTDDPESSL